MQFDVVSYKYVIAFTCETVLLCFHYFSGFYNMFSFNFLEHVARASDTCSIYSYSIYLLAHFLKCFVARNIVSQLIFDK